MRAGMALAAALAAMAVGAPSAGATAADCQPRGCVLLIEVDGLEPGDVSRTETPFLWALAHPSASGQTDPAGQAAQVALANRNGFMWQAGRAPMQAATAPATASLLTGANPDDHGVLADELLEPTLELENPFEPRRLRPARDEGGGGAKPLSGTGAASTMFELVLADQEAEAAAYVGNPALAKLLEDDLAPLSAARKWWPTEDAPGDPSLCPAPRRVTTNGSETTSGASGTLQRDCPARDAATLQAAFSSLTANNTTPRFTYIHLAETGRVKQRSGEPEAASTLVDTDAALAAFFQGLSRHINTSGGWGSTIVVVTGNHGYEPTPLSQRVAHPTDSDATFAEFVTDMSEGEQRALFVPQGTIGTVYWPSATTEQLTAMAGAIEGACTCIEEVVPTATLAELHRTWHLNPLAEDGLPTGAGGQLLVTTKPGWAFGEVEPATTGDDAADPNDDGATNPDLASAGGPRNRAIAVILNGPRAGLTNNVRQVSGDWMGVNSSAQAPPACRSGDVANANDPERVGDDADAPGHECQPETVDIPLSIAGVLGLSLGGQQAPQARFLNEAFSPPIGDEPVVIADDGDDEEELPPPDPPPVVIRTGSVQVIPPPPFVDPFPYRGLVRRLRVRVTDAKGRTFRQARRGARMSSVEVGADFGKEQSLVTLTFYRRARTRSGAPGGRLKALARFKPFVVKRGPVKLKLKIPRQFRPTHLGVAVQEVEGAGRVKRPVGSPGGGIAAIADAKRLHARKGVTRRAARRLRR
jgi:hypothetical protein